MRPVNRALVRVAFSLVAVAGCGSDEHTVFDAPPGQPDAAPMPDATGADCSAAPCVGGTYCALDGAGGAACADRVAVGGTCTAVDACVAGATCNLDPAAGQGTCVAVGEDGAQCDPAAFGTCAGID